MSADFKSADELFAEGLVAKLELEPGKKYILVFKRDQLSPYQIDICMAWLIEQNIDGFMIAVSGKPKDAIVGLEIHEQRS